MIADRLALRRQASPIAPAPVPDSPRPDAPRRPGGLVLSRQLGESIMIGESVAVEVVALKSNTTRLRVVAPRSVAVHRSEVFDAIRLAEGSATEPGAGSTFADATADGSGPEGCLVLSRRAGQSIVIGGAVVVDVVEVRPGVARLRVVAPRSVAVHRREVFDAIRADRVHA